jgi:hypothetical protein
MVVAVEVLVPDQLVECVAKFGCLNEGQPEVGGGERLARSSFDAHAAILPDTTLEQASANGTSVRQ